MAALMLLSGPMYETLAQDADLYAQLSTDDWRQDGEVITYEYDDNGSLIRETRRIAGDITEDKTYNYNLENRLSGATITYPGSPEIVNALSYVYNQDGIRVSKRDVVTADAVIESDETTLFLVDSFNHTGYAQVLEEHPSAGALPTRSYTIGDDVLGQADRISNFQFQTSHLLYDGHGSTRQLSGETGAVTACYRFDAYGVMLGGNPASAALRDLGVGNPTTATDLLYSGEQFDSGLGQQYLRARAYDPSTGRFIRVDPFSGDNGDPQSLHKYAYVHGDPVNGVDPSGRLTLLELLIVVAVVAVAASIVAPLISGVRRRIRTRFATAWLGRVRQGMESIGAKGVGGSGGPDNALAHAIANIMAVVESDEPAESVLERFQERELGNDLATQMDRANNILGNSIGGQKLDSSEAIISALISADGFQWIEVDPDTGEEKLVTGSLPEEQVSQARALLPFFEEWHFR